MIRFVATGTLIAFLSTSVWQPLLRAETASGETVQNPMPLHDLKIPGELGTLESFVLSGSANAPFVVIIQDAHAIRSAQEKIQNIIGYLKNQYGISLVAFEGAKGRLDPTLFRSFPDEAAKKKVMEDYLQKGEITATEMAAVFGNHKNRFWGIEDWGLYQENYFAYLRAMEQKGRVLGVLNEIKSGLDGRRAKVLGPVLNELLLRANAFFEEKDQFISFLDYLKKSQAGWINRDPAGFQKQYPHLAVLLKTLDGDTPAGRESLNLEIRQMAESFRRDFAAKLSKEEQMDFNGRWQAFLSASLDPAVFLKYVIDMGRKIGLKSKLTPRMAEALANANDLKAIKGSRLYDELVQFLNDLQGQLAVNQAQKEMIAQYRTLRVLRNLASLEWTHPELEEYQKAPDAYLDLMGPNKIWLRDALEFYRLALERDEKFRDNLGKLMREHDAQSAVFVAGGFHTRGLQSRLEQAGVSYAVVMPRIESLEGDGLYPELMRGNLSYKGYLKDSFYDAFVRHASEKLFASYESGQFKLQLKLWRDEIIRNLANEGRLGEAGTYTRHVDDLFKIYAEKFPDAQNAVSGEALSQSIREEIARFGTNAFERLAGRISGELRDFAGGLKGLIDTRELNAKNIGELVGQIARPKPSMLQIPGCHQTFVRQGPDERLIIQAMQAGSVLAPIPTIIEENTAAPLATLEQFDLALKDAAGTVNAVDLLAENPAVKSEAREMFVTAQTADRVPDVKTSTPDISAAIARVRSEIPAATDAAIANALRTELRHQAEANGPQTFDAEIKLPVLAPSPEVKNAEARLTALETQMAQLQRTVTQFFQPEGNGSSRSPVLQEASPGSPTLRSEARGTRVRDSYDRRMNEIIRLDNSIKVRVQKLFKQFRRIRLAYAKKRKWFPDAVTQFYRSLAADAAIIPQDLAIGFVREANFDLSTQGFARTLLTGLNRYGPTVQANIEKMQKKTDVIWREITDRDALMAGLSKTVQPEPPSKDAGEKQVRDYLFLHLAEIQLRLSAVLERIPERQDRLLQKVRESLDRLSRIMEIQAKQTETVIAFPIDEFRAMAAAFQNISRIRRQDGIEVDLVEQGAGDAIGGKTREALFEVSEKMFALIEVFKDSDKLLQGQMAIPGETIPRSEARMPHMPEDYKKAFRISLGGMHKGPMGRLVRIVEDADIPIGARFSLCNLTFRVVRASEKVQAESMPFLQRQNEGKYSAGMAEILPYVLEVYDIRRARDAETGKVISVEKFWPIPEVHFIAAESGDSESCYIGRYEIPSGIAMASDHRQDLGIRPISLEDGIAMNTGARGGIAIYQTHPFADGVYLPSRLWMQAITGYHANPNLKYVVEDYRNQLPEYPDNVDPLAYAIPGHAEIKIVNTPTGPRLRLTDRGSRNGTEFETTVSVAAELPQQALQQAAPADELESMEDSANTMIIPQGQIRTVDSDGALIWKPKYPFAVTVYDENRKLKFLIVLQYSQGQLLVYDDTEATMSRQVFDAEATRVAGQPLPFKIHLKKSPVGLQDLVIIESLAGTQDFGYQPVITVMTLELGKRSEARALEFMAPLLAHVSQVSGGFDLQTFMEIAKDFFQSPEGRMGWYAFWGAVTLYGIKNLVSYSRASSIKNKAGRYADEARKNRHSATLWRLNRILGWSDKFYAYANQAMQGGRWRSDDLMVRSQVYDAARDAFTAYMQTLHDRILGGGFWDWWFRIFDLNAHLKRISMIDHPELTELARQNLSGTARAKGISKALQAKLRNTLHAMPPFDRSEARLPVRPARIGTKEKKELRDFLASATEHERHRALQTLVKRRAVSFSKTLLADPDPLVRGAAAMALREISVQGVSKKTNSHIQSALLAAFGKETDWITAQILHFNLLALGINVSEYPKVIKDFNWDHSPGITKVLSEFVEMLAREGYGKNIKRIIAGNGSYPQGEWIMGQDVDFLEIYYEGIPAGKVREYEAWLDQAFLRIAAIPQKEPTILNEGNGLDRLQRRNESGEPWYVEIYTPQDGFKLNAKATYLGEKRQIRKRLFKTWEDGGFTENEKSLIQRIQGMKAAETIYDIPALIINPTEWQSLETLESKGFIHVAREAGKIVTVSPLWMAGLEVWDLRPVPERLSLASLDKEKLKSGIYDLQYDVRHEGDWGGFWRQFRAVRLSSQIRMDYHILNGADRQVTLQLVDHERKIAEVTAFFPDRKMQGTLEIDTSAFAGQKIDQINIVFNHATNSTGRVVFSNFRITAPDPDGQEVAFLSKNGIPASEYRPSRSETRTGIKIEVKAEGKKTVVTLGKPFFDEPRRVNASETEFDRLMDELDVKVTRTGNQINLSRILNVIADTTDARRLTSGMHVIFRDRDLYAYQTPGRGNTYPPSPDQIFVRFPSQDSGTAEVLAGTDDFIQRMKAYGIRAKYKGNNVLMRRTLKERADITDVESLKNALNQIFNPPTPKLKKVKRKTQKVAERGRPIGFEPASWEESVSVAEFVDVLTDIGRGGEEVQLTKHISVSVNELLIDEHRETIMQGIRQLRRAVGPRQFDEGLSYMELAGKPAFLIEQQTALVLIAVGRVMGLWRIFPDPSQYVDADLGQDFPDIMRALPVSEGALPYYLEPDIKKITRRSEARDRERIVSRLGLMEETGRVLDLKARESAADAVASRLGRLGLWGHGVGVHRSVFRGDVSDFSKKADLLNVMLSGHIWPLQNSLIQWAARVQYLSALAASVGVFFTLSFWQAVIVCPLLLACAGLVYYFLEPAFFGPFASDRYLQSPKFYGPYWVVIDPQTYSLSPRSGLAGFLESIKTKIKQWPYYWSGIPARDHLAYVVPDEEIIFFADQLDIAATQGLITAQEAEDIKRKIIPYTQVPQHPILHPFDLSSNAPVSRAEARSTAQRQHEFMPQPSDGFALQYDRMIVYGASSETKRTDTEGLLSAKIFYVFEGRFAGRQEDKILNHIEDQGDRKAYALVWKKFRDEIGRLNQEIKKEERPEVVNELKKQRQDLQIQLQTMFREDKQCPPDFVLVPLDKLLEMENERLNPQHEGPVGGDNLFALTLDARDKGRERIDALGEEARLRISAASLIRFIVMVKNEQGDEVPHVLLVLMPKRFMETGEARYIPVGGGVLYAVDYPEDWARLPKERQLEILKQAPLRRKLETEFQASSFEGDKKIPLEADMRFQAPVVFKTTMRGFEISRRNFDELHAYMTNWQRHQDELESPLKSAQRETGEELVDELHKFGRNVFESLEDLFGGRSEARALVLKRSEGGVIYFSQGGETKLVLEVQKIRKSDTGFEIDLGFHHPAEAAIESRDEFYNKSADQRSVIKPLAFLSLDHDAPVKTMPGLKMGDKIFINNEVIITVGDSKGSDQVSLVISAPRYLGINRDEVEVRQAGEFKQARAEARMPDELPGAKYFRPRKWAAMVWTFNDLIDAGTYVRENRPSTLSELQEAFRQIDEYAFSQGWSPAGNQTQQQQIEAAKRNAVALYVLPVAVRAINSLDPKPQLGNFLSGDTNYSVVLWNMIVLFLSQAPPYLFINPIFTPDEIVNILMYRIPFLASQEVQADLPIKLVRESHFVPPEIMKTWQGDVLQRLRAQTYSETYRHGYEITRTGDYPDLYAQGAREFVWWGRQDDDWMMDVLFYNPNAMAEDPFEGFLQIAQRFEDANRGEEEQARKPKEIQSLGGVIRINATTGEMYWVASRMDRPRDERKRVSDLPDGQAMAGQIVKFILSLESHGLDERLHKLQDILRARSEARAKDRRSGAAQKSYDELVTFLDDWQQYLRELVSAGELSENDLRTFELVHTGILGEEETIPEKFAADTGIRTKTKLKREYSRVIRKIVGSFDEFYPWQSPDRITPKFSISDHARQSFAQAVDSYGHSAARKQVERFLKTLRPDVGRSFQGRSGTRRRPIHYFPRSNRSEARGARRDKEFHEILDQVGYFMHESAREFKYRLIASHHQLGVLRELSRLGQNVEYYLHSYRRGPAPKFDARLLEQTVKLTSSVLAFLSDYLNEAPQQHQKEIYDWSTHAVFAWGNAAQMLFSVLKKFMIYEGPDREAIRRESDQLIKTLVVGLERPAVLLSDLLERNPDLYFQIHVQDAIDEISKGASEVLRTLRQSHIFSKEPIDQDTLERLQGLAALSPRSEVRGKSVSGMPEVERWTGDNGPETREEEDRVTMPRASGSVPHLDRSEGRVGPNLPPLLVNAAYRIAFQILFTGRIRPTQKIDRTKIHLKYRGAKNPDDNLKQGEIIVAVGDTLFAFNNGTQIGISIDATTNTKTVFPVARTNYAGYLKEDGYVVPDDLSVQEKQEFLDLVVDLVNREIDGNNDLYTNSIPTALEWALNMLSFAENFVETLESGVRSETEIQSLWEPVMRRLTWSSWIFEQYNLLLMDRIHELSLENTELQSQWAAYLEWCRRTFPVSGDVNQEEISKKLEKGLDLQRHKNFVAIALNETVAKRQGETETFLAEIMHLASTLWIYKMSAARSEARVEQEHPDYPRGDSFAKVPELKDEGAAVERLNLKALKPGDIVQITVTPQRQYLLEIERDGMAKIWQMNEANGYYRAAIGKIIASGILETGAAVALPDFRWTGETFEKITGADEDGRLFMAKFLEQVKLARSPEVLDDVIPVDFENGGGRLDVPVNMDFTAQEVTPTLLALLEPWAADIRSRIQATDDMPICVQVDKNGITVKSGRSLLPAGDRLIVDTLRAGAIRFWKSPAIDVHKNLWIDMIFNEQLTNAARNANSKVTVRMIRQQRQDANARRVPVLQVFIEDDGPGFNFEALQHAARYYYDVYVGTRFSPPGDEAYDSGAFDPRIAPYVQSWSESSATDFGHWFNAVKAIVEEGHMDWRYYHDFLYRLPFSEGVLTGRAPLDMDLSQFAAVDHIIGEMVPLDVLSARMEELKVALQMDTAQTSAETGWWFLFAGVENSLEVTTGRGKYFTHYYLNWGMQGRFESWNQFMEGRGFRVFMEIPVEQVMAEGASPDETMTEIGSMLRDNIKATRCDRVQWDVAFTDETVDRGPAIAAEAVKGTNAEKTRPEARSLDRLPNDQMEPASLVKSYKILKINIPDAIGKSQGVASVIYDWIAYLAGNRLDVPQGVVRLRNIEHPRSGATIVLTTKMRNDEFGTYLYSIGLEGLPVPSDSLLHFSISEDFQDSVKTPQFGNLKTYNPAQVSALLKVMRNPRFFTEYGRFVSINPSTVFKDLAKEFGAVSLRREGQENIRMKLISSGEGIPIYSSTISIVARENADGRIQIVESKVGWLPEGTFIEIGNRGEVSFYSGSGKADLYATYRMDAFSSPVVVIGDANPSAQIASAIIQENTGADIRSESRRKVGPVTAGREDIASLIRPAPMRQLPPDFSLADVLPERGQLLSVFDLIEAEDYRGLETILKDTIRDESSREERIDEWQAKVEKSVEAKLVNIRKEMETAEFTETAAQIARQATQIEFEESLTRQFEPWVRKGWIESAEVKNLSGRIFGILTGAFERVSETVAYLASAIDSETIRAIDQRLETLGQGGDALNLVVDLPPSSARGDILEAVRRLRGDVSELTLIYRDGQNGPDASWAKSGLVYTSRSYRELQQVIDELRRRAADGWHKPVFSFDDNLPKQSGVRLGFDGIVTQVSQIPEARRELRILLYRLAVKILKLLKAAEIRKPAEAAELLKRELQNAELGFLADAFQFDSGSPVTDVVSLLEAFKTARETMKRAA